MPNIKKITLPSGTTYDIVDAGARELIQELNGYTSYLGITTTALSDGSTTNPIKIGTDNVTAKNGNIVNYGSKEFIFNGTSWQEFGDLSGLGGLAFKDSASGSYKPEGTVSQPTFTGKSMTSTGKFTPEGTVTLVPGAKQVNAIVSETTDHGNVPSYTPKGTISQPTFTGKSMTSTGKFTPEGSVNASLTGTTRTLNVVITTGAASVAGTYTPSGTISEPTITVTPNTSTVNSITDVGTLPSFTATVTDEILTLGFNQGTLPSKGSDMAVVTGIESATSTAPSFTGTRVTMQTQSFNLPTGCNATFIGSEGNVSVSGTTSGTVSAPTFTGTGVVLETDNFIIPSGYTASFVGTEGDVSVTGTTDGTVSKPTFTGTSKNVTVS